MRRKDREVTDIAVMQDWMEEFEVCRLGLVDGDLPYIVPMNFGAMWKDQRLVVYLHCAAIGYKLDLLAKNPKVCVEWDGHHQLLKSPEDPSECTYAYRSLIGRGTAELVEENEDKLVGIGAIMRQYYKREVVHNYPEGLLKRTAIIRVTVDELTAKEHSR